jgi:uncharacterized protein
MNWQTGKTLLLALAGGFLFQTLHIPLAWLLGPMTALLVWREVFKQQAVWFKPLRDGGLTILGYMMGITFSGAVAVQILQQLPSMAAATLITVAFGMAAGWVTVKRTGISMASGLLGSIPGGLSQMATLCDEVEDADMAVVTFMQTIRVMAVVFIVPFLAFHGLSSSQNNGVSPNVQPPAAAITVQAKQEAPDTAAADTPVKSSGSAAAAGKEAESGEQSTVLQDTRTPVSWLSWNALWYIMVVGGLIWLAPKLHLPTPYMLGPMLGAAVLRSFDIGAPGVPSLCIIAAQVLVGTHMGVSTSLSSLANWRKLLPYAIFGAVGIVLFSLGTGYVMTLWHPMSLLTAFLGAAPGGMTEMGLTGAALGADLSIIVAYQMFRLLFILFIAPYMVKGLLRVYRTRTDSAVKGLYR